MTERTPFLVCGDAPNITGGLARIARDITTLLHQSADSLGIEVFQAGIRYDGSPWPWRVFPLHDEEHWGKGDWKRVWQWCAGGRKGVVLSVWDPARCWELTDAKLPGAELWGYFAIDAETEFGGFGGPAAEAVQRYNRVLAYGGWGMQVLKKVAQEGKDIRWLPHGMEIDKWMNRGWEERQREDILGSTGRLLGCVATNQPRKDLALLFAAATRLKKESGWQNLHLWLHTDFLVKSWSVTELAELYGWNSKLLTVTQEMRDEDLAEMYGRCSVTFAPGLGEGFGYPIVESLAAGTPVVHGKFGGGQEWVPRDEWVVAPAAYRIEGTYALQRPIFDVEGVVAALIAAGEEKERDAKTTAAYCQGAVRNLDWRVLWPRWRSWVKAGLEAKRREDAKNG